MNFAIKILTVISFLLIIFISFEIQDVDAQIDPSCASEIPNIANFNLISSERVSNTICKGLYEDANNRFIVKNTKLGNYTAAINFVAYEYVPSYFNSIITTINDQKVLKDHNTLVWISGKSVYRIDFEEKSNYNNFANSVLRNFPSDIGKSQDDTIIFFKKFEAEEINKDAQQSTPSQPKAKISYKTTGSSSCSDCGGTWWDTNICDPDECWSLGDCYSKDYFYCYSRPSSGSDDYCLYKSQKNRGGCAKGESDCDSNPECSGSLLCKGPLFGTDGCCASSEEWKNNQCVKTCSASYTGTTRCAAGNVIEKEYRNIDCSTTWKTDIDCDNNDRTDSWGSNYCSSGNIKQSRTIHDFSCSAGACADSQRTEEKTVESCSNGCSNNRCNQCTSNSYQGCYDNDLYNYDSCGNRGAMIQDCQNTNSVCTSDNGGGRYYNGYCDSSSNRCMHSNFESCNDCSSGSCAHRCDISSVRWSKSSAQEGEIVDLIVEGDSDCNGKTVRFEVREADLFGDNPVVNNPSQTRFDKGRAISTWATEWQDDGIFNDPEYFFNAFVDDQKTKSSGSELSISKRQLSCELTSAYWEETRFQENSFVKLTVEGRNCDGKIASFEVKEENVFGTSDARNNPPSTEFYNGKAVVSWFTEWVEDGWLEDDPEYLFIAKVDSKTITSNNRVEVYQQCLDNDGDGYGQGYSSACTYSGIDCKDDDPNTKPGNYDSCNNKDDNCDGVVDENNNKQSDINNCGSCNNVCSFSNANAACSSGTCSISSCLSNYGNCDGSNNNGCETYLLNDNNNCGGCGNICSQNQICSNGGCTDVLPVESCNNNGICDPGENINGCYNDCKPIITCNNNGICESEENRDNCYNDCKLPNECNSNSDCPLNQFCNLVSGQDFCEPVKYKDECSNYNDYFCENGWVKKCADNGNFFENQRIKSCTGKYQYCDEDVVDGTGDCSTSPNHLDAWIDYADTGVNVNKQQGDKLILNVYSEQSTTINIRYNTESFEGNCPNGLLSVSEGVNKCELSVIKNNPSRENIQVEKKVLSINIINDPEFITITDSEKLFERFQNEENGVKALLKQAYSNAESRGVVYDLKEYELVKEESLVHKIIALNPFRRLSDYNEKVDNPSMTDNSYSIAVSRFIKEKCKDCEDVMILGDDFIVPHYRRDIPTLKKEWFFFDNKEIKEIYTDAPYVNKKTLQFSNYYEMFKVEGKYQGKDVVMVLPDSVNEEQRSQIGRLENALKNKGYNPDFSDVNSKDINCIDESWFSNTKGKTLIIIGTEENNNAFKCMPFIAGQVNRDSAFIQPNVWDNQEYSIVLNTNDPEVIGFFSYLVETGSIVNLKGESAYFFKIGTQYAGYAAMGVGVGSLILFSGGTAAPALLLSAGALLEGISDAGSATDACVVNNEGMMWCGLSVGFAALPFVPSGPAKEVIKKFGDDILNENLFKMFEDVEPLMNKHFNKLRSSPRIGNIAFENAIKTAQDNIHMAKGAEKLLGDMGIADIAIVKSGKIKSENLAEGIKEIGKLEDAGVNLDEGIMVQLRNHEADPGHLAEIKVASKRLEEMDVLVLDRLNYAKGKTIDGVEVIDARLTVSKEYFDNTPEWAKTMAAENQISIITFEGVR
ncbi:hypothetical protein HYT57_04265 [Candidatus Woesearchaeota archaeon]|nr:hypothetical protein [Candidatus Woesearchaeota archaeon]